MIITIEVSKPVSTNFLTLHFSLWMDLNKYYKPYS